MNKKHRAAQQLTFEDYLNEKRETATPLSNHSTNSILTTISGNVNSPVFIIGNGSFTKLIKSDRSGGRKALNTPKPYWYKYVFSMLLALWSVIIERFLH